MGLFRATRGRSMQSSFRRGKKRGGTSRFAPRAHITKHELQVCPVLHHRQGTHAMALVSRKHAYGHDSRARSSARSSSASSLTAPATFATRFSSSSSWFGSPYPCSGASTSNTAGSTPGHTLLSAPQRGRKRSSFMSSRDA